MGDPSFNVPNLLVFDLTNDNYIFFADKAADDAHRDERHIDPSDYPPVPVDARTVISVVRKATPLDLMGGWLYGLRWKGSQPRNGGSGS